MTAEIMQNVMRLGNINLGAMVKDGVVVYYNISVISMDKSKSNGEKKSSGLPITRLRFQQNTPTSS
jgi:Cu/Ag efflux pump CusA